MAVEVGGIGAREGSEGRFTGGFRRSTVNASGVLGWGLAKRRRGQRTGVASADDMVVGADEESEAIHARYSPLMHIAQRARLFYEETGSLDSGGSLWACFGPTGTAVLYEETVQWSVVAPKVAPSPCGLPPFLVSGGSFCGGGWRSPLSAVRPGSA